jgi:colicin import membrane protein
MFTCYNLDSFTTDALRKYCQDNDLNPGGHKGELMDRIRRYLEKEEALKNLMMRNKYESEAESFYRESLAAKREAESRKKAEYDSIRLQQLREEANAKAMAELFVSEARAQYKADLKAREEERILQELRLAEAKAKAEAEEEERRIKEIAKAKAEAMSRRQRLLADAIDSLFKNP